MNGEGPQETMERPRHALMRTRRTSMPAMVATTAHNTVRPKIGNKRLSTASTFSLTSFESLPEEGPPVLEVSEIHSEPAKITNTVENTNIMRPPILRRSPPSRSSQPQPRPISISSVVSEPGMAATTPDSKRLSLPVPASKYGAKGSSRSPSPLGLSREKSKGHAHMRRSTTEPIPPKHLSLSSVDFQAQEKRAAKRTKIIQELVDTERAYVGVLSQIQEHYLDPLMKAAVSATPEQPSTLDRKGISEIFANFTDILVLAREMLRRLEQGATPCPPTEPVESAIEFPFFSSPRRKTPAPQNLSPPHASAAAVISGMAGSLILPVCPFLKCYSLFIRNFSRALARIRTEDEQSEQWRAFVAERKKRGVGQGLDLSAMLLNIIQRIPRYRLLLSDLIDKTDHSHPDYSDSLQAFQVIEQVATFLNDSIRLHDSTMQIYELQKAMIGLEEPLVIAGRQLVKTGKLRKVGRRDEQLLHFFLFNDALLYASDVVTTPGWSRAVSMTGLSAIAEQRSAANAISPPPYKTRHNSLQISGGPQQYHFHHLLALKEMTVINSEGCYFEIRTPEKGFAVAAFDTYEKEEWIEAIRSARDDWVSARRTLQTDSQEDFEQYASLPALTRSTSSTPSTNSTPLTPEMSLQTLNLPPVKRRYSDNSPIVSPEESAVFRMPDNYSAPVWIPDHKVIRCMQCQESFGLWRRKHHCRLCGNIVCWSCSTNNFAIPALRSSGNIEQAKSRACDACYKSCFDQEEAEPVALSKRLSTYASPSLLDLSKYV